MNKKAKIIFISTSNTSFKDTTDYLKPSGNIVLFMMTLSQPQINSSKLWTNNLYSELKKCKPNIIKNNAEDDIEGIGVVGNRQKNKDPSEHLSAIDIKDVVKSTSQQETEILENQCGDCYKIMKSAKTVIDHKKKFRCPGKKVETTKQTDLEDLKTKKTSPEEKAAEGET